MKKKYGEVDDRNDTRIFYPQFSVRIFYFHIIGKIAHSM